MSLSKFIISANPNNNVPPKIPNKRAANAKPPTSSNNTKKPITHSAIYIQPNTFIVFPTVFAPLELCLIAAAS